MVHFNVPRDWFETNSRHQKRYSKGGKRIRGCRGLLGRVNKNIQLKQFELKPEKFHLSSLLAVFHRLSKHLEFRQKYSPLRVVF